MNEAAPGGRTILCLFTRYPEPGKAKTRLVPSLGAVGAAALHKEMTEHSLRVLRSAAWVLQAHIEVRFTGADEETMREWLGHGVSFAEQGDGDLGARMNRAMEHNFFAGAGRVLLVGSDCPDMTAGHLIEACALLDRHVCVLGPAQDGGYYLIGLTKPVPGVFIGVDWGTARVLAQTIAFLKAARHTGKDSRPAYGLLPALSDVDQPEDIPPAVSVIIPVLNEENTISRLVADVLSTFKTECIVVDGGSGDGTREAAGEAGARVYSCSPGRARQMNLGAGKSRGEVLLFLHADSRLPSGWTREMERVLQHSQPVLGAFVFKLDAPSWKARCVEWGVRLRCRLFRLPYGDQGFFMTRDLFEQLGGFPELPILEDVALVRGARRAGVLVRFTDQPLTTSARRWRKLGYARTVFLNQCVLLAAGLGVPLEYIRACYGRGRNPLWELLPGKRPVSS